MNSAEKSLLQEINITQHGAVVSIELNMPENHNRLTRKITEEFQECLRSIENDNSCRVVILSGKGDYFCAGIDLDWLQQGKQQSRQQNISDSKSLYQLFESLYLFQKPIIAKLNNNVKGAGIGLIACCDIVVASKDVKLSIDDLRMGIIPSVILPFVLKKCGQSFTRRMAFTAEEFTCEQGLAAGLITDITDASNVASKTDDIVTAVLLNAPRATQLTKQMFNHFDDYHELDEHMSVYCTKANALTVISEEGHRGILAFLESNKPFWHL